MSTISIGQSQRNLEDASESWIASQVNGRKHDGQAVCVQIQLKTAGLDMMLSTPQCGGGGGGRPPNPKELEIFELWNSRHMNQQNWEVGNLIAFLKQLNRLI